MCYVPIPSSLGEVKPRQGLEAIPLDWTSGDKNWLRRGSYVFGNSCAIGLRSVDVFKLALKVVNILNFDESLGGTG